MTASRLRRNPLRSLIVPVARLSLALAVALVSGAAGAEDVARLIVKFRASATKAQLAPAARVERLAGESAVAIRHLRAMSQGADVVALERAVTSERALQLAALLARNPAVEYVEPDRRRYAAKVANDEFRNGQGYLDDTPGGISASLAWDVTTGSAATVVAVVDTGIRPHADLAGRILPGYDMIATTDVSNDGDGRDADPSDPGDWVLASEATGDCPAEDSSWHGTSVAGVIAANTNNGQWMSGINWSAMILPVRVLGKCGGYDSDIVDGIAWAAGLSVPGVPANPYPAHVINMSLGGDGACTASYQNAINAAYAHGVTRAIVAAAGNASGDVSAHVPANCPFVYAVASTTTQGRLARYSNFGAGIDVSAPGGEYRFNQGIKTLSNNGLTVPTTDGFIIAGGTSFAAPMVSGVVSLMLAVAPNLTADQVHTILLSTAKPFPAGSTCDTTICGAGIVDANAAVRAAAALAPASLDLDQHGFTGSWYEPATSGQGVELEFYVDAGGAGTAVVQGAWFTFDAGAAGGSERQRWYTFAGKVPSGQTSLPVTLYQNTGGNFIASPVTHAVAVGSGTLAFGSCTAGTFSYAFTDGTGRSGAIPLTRLTPNLTCAAPGATPTTNPDFALSGNWYDAAKSGQGLVFELNPVAPILFFTWYTYAPGGEAAGAAGQRWYTGQASYTPGARTIAATLYQTTGGLFDLPSTPAPQTVAVGTASVTFLSCAAATLTFNFTGGSSAGASGAIALTRVGPPPPGCAP